MLDQVDTLPYRTFKKLKQKYVVKTIQLTEHDMSLAGKHLLFKNHREYVEYFFAKIGVKVTRHAHNYRSLDTAHPQLGLVYLAGDSVIVQAMEVHALMGHNAIYSNEAENATKLKGL